MNVDVLVGKSGNVNANVKGRESRLRNLSTRSLGASRVLVKTGRIDITVRTSLERTRRGDDRAVEVEVATGIGKRVDEGERGEMRMVTTTTLGGVTREAAGDARRRGTGMIVASRKRSESLEKGRALKTSHPTRPPIQRELRTRTPPESTVIDIATGTGKTTLTTVVNIESTRNEAKTDTETTSPPTILLLTRTATRRNIVTAAIALPAPAAESLQDPLAISDSRIRLKSGGWTTDRARIHLAITTTGTTPPSPYHTRWPTH